MVVMSQNFEMGLPGFGPQLHHFPDNLAQVISFLSLGLLICKMGIVPVPISYLHTGAVKIKIT